MHDEFSFGIGFETSTVSENTGIAASVYGLAQLSSTATSSKLSDKFLYPYFSRLSAGGTEYSEAILTCITYYSNFEGGWDNVAILAEASEYPVSLSESFITLAANQDVTISSYLQYLQTEDRFDLEMELIKESRARIILFFVGVSGARYYDIIESASNFGLIGENYVWFVPPTIAEYSFPNASALSNGFVGPRLYIPESPSLDLFLELWNSADPEIYRGAGTTPNFIEYLNFDAAITSARAIDYLYNKNNRDLSLLQSITAPIWTDTIRNVSFIGVSGTVKFDKNGDRNAQLEMVYYDAANNQWKPSAIYTPASLSSSNEISYELISDIVWISNTTTIPDLDIRDPFTYWSCHDKKLKTDETGKTIQLQTPDKSDIDEIDSDYYCDKFIDCKNFSDESSDGCSSNFLILFIVFGILAGILICIAVILIVFVVIFGYVLQYRRVLKASPFFLILILVSVIIGISSIYAWFGKPHPVACAFQPWLLGLPCLSMITALTVKNFRLWRIFRFPMQKTRISNFDLCFFWSLIMIPAIIILIIWSIVSTPTAKMKKTGENEDDHYVCATGGFTEEPGGYVFFAIFVAYSFIVLLIGAFISIVSRKVPSQFNETKILTISIYNLGLLGIVIIPVFLAVNPFNPFIAWILRTIAILYAFTATMVIQFVPMIWGIVLMDKGKNKKVFKSMLQSTPQNESTYSSSTRS